MNIQDFKPITWTTLRARTDEELLFIVDSGPSNFGDMAKTELQRPVPQNIVRN